MDIKKNSLVILENDTAITTSLKIAEVFEKAHADVLKTIRSVDCPKEFIEGNFSLVEYADAKGEKRPMYQITL